MQPHRSENANPRCAKRGAFFEAVWPEGAAAKKATQQWCAENGVPGLLADAEETHRRRNIAHEQQPGFGFVNQPIAPGSAEWKSSAGQDCIDKERCKHERRGTWNLKPVIELPKLMEETQATGEVVVLGGIHPILYKKHAEDPNIAVNRCRIVYNAPQARTTQSGLNVHVLYNEISPAPVTFQGARASRAVGALRGFITSTRDAMEAYMQASLKRKGSPRTFIALPRCFWPKEWGERYKRPMVELDLALFGHPEAGNLWENHAFSKLKTPGMGRRARVSKRVQAQA